jgi:hypothetical protein
MILFLVVFGLSFFSSFFFEKKLTMEYTLLDTVGMIFTVNVQKNADLGDSIYAVKVIALPKFRCSNQKLKIDD